MKNPSNREFQKRFDLIAKNYEKISNQYTIKRRAESLVNEANGLILEVGSATGIVTASIDSTIICTDISFEMCKQAKVKRSFVICCDAEKLPFRENTFNGIISAEMIYYLENPTNFISYSYKILKNNGKLVLSMANKDMTILDKIRSWLRHRGMNRTYFDDGLKEFMKLEQLKTILENYNFKIKSVEKKVIFPFKSFDKLNRLLESTPLNYFCIFIIMKATK